MGKGGGERYENCKSVWGRGLGTVLSGRNPGGRGTWDPPLQVLNPGAKGPPGGRPTRGNSGDKGSSGPPENFLKEENFFHKGENNFPKSPGFPVPWRTRLGDLPRDRDFRCREGTRMGRRRGSKRQKFQNPSGGVEPMTLRLVDGLVSLSRCQMSLRRRLSSFPSSFPTARSIS